MNDEKILHFFQPGQTGALLNEFLLENGCRDYSGVTPTIIDWMCKAVEEGKTKSVMSDTPSVFLQKSSLERLRHG